MPSFECGNCLPVNVPGDWTDEKKAEVAALIRKTSPIFAVQYFRPIAMNLGDAKNIAVHVTREKGFCRCKMELTEYEGKCPKCKTLNLDW